MYACMYYVNINLEQIETLVCMYVCMYVRMYSDVICLLHMTSMPTITRYVCMYVCVYYVCMKIHAV